MFLAESVIGGKPLSFPRAQRSSVRGDVPPLTRAFVILMDSCGAAAGGGGRGRAGPGKGVAAARKGGVRQLAERNRGVRRVTRGKMAG